jgi:histidinol-phosphatase (PHP family)
VLVDYHMHLRDSGERIAHRVDAVEPFVEAAARRGVDEIGFSEHVYYFRETRALWDRPYESERCVYGLDAYVDAVLEAKRRGLPVKLGLEVDHVGERQDELAAVLEPYPWDFLLGSVHNVEGLAVDSAPDGGVWAELTVDEVWRRYFDALGELASSGHVDVLAHPDLPKIFGRRPEAGVEYPALENVALEISTNGRYKPVGELYPDRAFLDAARLPITLASDAHVPENAGRDLDQAVDFARGAGYKSVTVFEGRRARQEPLG